MALEGSLGGGASMRNVLVNGTKEPLLEVKEFPMVTARNLVFEEV